MALLQFSDYRPDTSDFEGASVHSILNVQPRGDGYGPFPSFSGYAQPLPATCRGAFYALKSDGTVITFAGTADRLYQMSNTDFSWIPVGLPVAVTSITNANPAVVSYTSHGYAAGDSVVFSGTVLPAHIVAGTVYYVATTSLGVNSFKVSSTRAGALAGTGLIDTSADSGSGTPKVTSIYSTLSAKAQWQFAQTGNLVWATQANVVLQVFDLSSGSSFSVALGSPPQAAYVSVVGRFLVLSGLLSFPFRIQWSGLNSFNASTSWTSGVSSSDFQDFPDGGIVRGVAGGEAGIIFQDQSIRRMSYVPGSPIIFQIDRITQDKGLFAPYSIIRAGEVIYFFAGQGFHKIVPGGVPEQIGREKVDRTFLADLDKGNLQLFIGAADPRSTRVYWAYRSANGVSTSLYDKVLGYDPALDRFFPLAITGEFLLGISQTGLTLENLDSISSSLDALTLSLDSYATAVQPQIAQFDNTHMLGFFSGTNLEATIESSEQAASGPRVTLRGFTPITDATTFFGSVTYRDTQAGTSILGAEVARNSRTGRCDMMRDARYIRYKLRIPAGTTWTFAAGIEPDVTTSGAI